MSHSKSPQLMKLYKPLMDNYQYLVQKSSSRSNKNLESIKTYFSDEELYYLGNKSVSIVGTNGKTSTATMLNGLLLSEGVKTCLFTSPHLIALNERIQTNTNTISDSELDSHMSSLRAFENENNIVLGYFESIFLIAAKTFIEKELGIFIVEAGIGGRLDTTSILNSRTVCLTNVGLDHTQLLGNSVKEILHEKLLVSQQIENFILGSSQIHKEYESYIKSLLNITDNQYSLGFMSESRNMFKASAQKNYVKSNQNTAQAVGRVILNNLNINKNTGEFTTSHKYIRPNGRFQIINEKPNFKILDGAHNPPGIKAFFDLFEDSYSEHETNRIDCYIAFNKNKDFEKMVNIIWSKKYVNVKILEDDLFDDQLDSRLLCEYHNSEGKQFAKGTLNEFHSTNKPSILLGSLYLVGEYIKEYK